MHTKSQLYVSCREKYVLKSDVFAWKLNPLETPENAASKEWGKEKCQICLFYTDEHKKCNIFWIIENTLVFKMIPKMLHLHTDKQKKWYF